MENNTSEAIVLDNITFEINCKGVKILIKNLTLTDSGHSLGHSAIRECISQGLIEQEETDSTDLKLIWKGRTIPLNDTALSVTIPSTSIAATSLPHVIKLFGILTKLDSIEKVHERDRKYQSAKKNYEYALKTTPKASAGLSSKEAQYICRTLEVLPEFSDSARAKNILKNIQQDHGIRYIMNKYEWSVEVLAELHPNERTILGYNRNKGQKIALRLRTDDLSGFRSFDSIRKVMIHELTHMIHSDHNAAFHALCRDLERQVASMNTGIRVSGAHAGFSTSPVSFSNDLPDPSSSNSAGALLGRTLGSSGIETQNRNISSNERPHRDILANAAMTRLSQQEIEITEGCGNSSSTLTESKKNNESI